MIPQTPTAVGGDPSSTHPHPGLWPGVGSKRTGIETQSLVPLNVSGVAAPFVAEPLYTAFTISLDYDK